KHTEKEERFFCIGKVEDRILTVRFTYRGNKIRIFGAGLWRKGKWYYEKDK
ncbi:MAG: BrnT family toxin, partial [Candidatus Omnitrophica bacterium]|nr:BrnT family toxin [Candidatus Omnitrophota bacterium]